MQLERESLTVGIQKVAVVTRLNSVLYCSGPAVSGRGLCHCLGQYFHIYHNDQTTSASLVLVNGGNKQI